VQLLPHHKRLSAIQSVGTSEQWKFYGVTAHGGVSDVGTSSSHSKGSIDELHSFGGADGEYQLRSHFGTDEIFMGRLRWRRKHSCGGGCGTLIQDDSWRHSDDHISFQGFSDGQSPTGGVVQGTDGNFYGLVNWAKLHRLFERLWNDIRNHLAESSRPCTHSAPA